jgi:hypothetical protein
MRGYPTSFRGFEKGKSVKHPEHGEGVVIHVGGLAYLDVLGVRIDWQDGMVREYVWNSGRDNAELDRVVIR